MNDEAEVMEPEAEAPEVNPIESMVDNIFSKNFAGAQTYGSMTQTHTLYLKWIDGAGTDNLVSWATNQGTVSMSHPNINGGNTMNVQRLSVSVPSSITLPSLTQPSGVSYTVTNAGGGKYGIAGAASGDMQTLVLCIEDQLIHLLLMQVDIHFILQQTMVQILVQEVTMVNIPVV